MALSLESISKTKKNQPARVVIHAVEGIGKSTFAANLPNPIFIDTDDGLAGINTNAFPLAKSWADVKDAISVLINEDHNFDTLVIDTIDKVEELIHAQVARDEGESQVSDIAYGKGYSKALLYLDELLQACDYLRNKKNMMIVFLAHTNVQLFKSPIVEPYHRYEVALHKEASETVREWCDVLGFANWHVMTHSDGESFGKKQNRGVSSGVRELHLVERAAWQAKNRYDMPDTIKFNALDPSEFLGLIYKRDEEPMAASSEPSAEEAAVATADEDDSEA